MTGGTLALGLQSGLTISLLAAGLVLVYKANRFINLAHAQLGAVSSSLLAKWVLDDGWNFWVALLVAVAIGCLTGVVVEHFLVAPIRRTARSPLVMLLATTGIAQILLALIYVPMFGPNHDDMAPFPQPFDKRWSIGGVLLSGMDILTFVLAPLVIIALALFLRYAALGRQIRASANNPDAARLCGVSASAVSRLAWGLAGALSSIAAVLAAPTQSSYDLAALGPYLLMVTLGAAAFGAFVSLPGALVGGLVLGVVGRAVADHTGNDASAQVAMLVVVLLVLLVRGRAISTAFTMRSAEAPEIPPLRIAPQLRASQTFRIGRHAPAPLTLLAAIALPFVPGFNNNGDRFILVLVLVYALIGISMSMLLGWAGQVSLGHWAIVGVSAFIASRLFLAGWSLGATFLVGGIAGVVALMFLGLPTLRIRGFSLAVTTLGFAVVAPNWLFQLDALVPSGTSGVSLQPPPLARGLATPVSQLSIYFIGLVILVLAVASTTVLRRSSMARAVIAVRDNEKASSTLGLMPGVVTLAVLAAAGLVAGLAGVLYTASYRYVSPTQFTADISIAVLAIPVVGGLGSVRGAVAGAVVLYLPTLFLLPKLGTVLGNFGVGPGVPLLVAGLALVVCLRKLPNGLAGAAQGWWQRILDALARDAPHPAEPALAGLATADLSSLGPRPTHERRRTRSERRLARTASGEVAVDTTLPLRVEGVRWHIGGIQVLDDPRIEVRPNEIVGLIGPNGAGKTSLMNVLSGLTRPDAGEAWMFGVPVLALSPDYRAAFDVARTFQDARLFGGLTLTETVQTALQPMHRTSLIAQALGAPWSRFAERRSRAAAERILTAFGLAEWADALTSEVSTGTRRICDLATQVATNPRLLLLDEPTGGVAQRDAEALGPLVRRIRDELGCSVLIIEHDMPLLMSVCDRVYVMASGSVIAEGTPAEVRRDPAVIASYLGTDPHAIERSGPLEPAGSSQPGTATEATR